MVCKGDLTSNWEFFKQQWQDYEVATGLDQKSQAIRVATFRSVMGKDCLQIFLNLKGQLSGKLPLFFKFSVVS